MNKNIHKVLYPSILLSLFIYMVVDLTATGHFKKMIGMIKPVNDLTAAQNKMIGDSKVSVRSDLSFFLDRVEKKLITRSGGDIKLMGAELTIPALALKTPEEISITALSSADIPALEPGLVNVTTGKGGYRFLPHGIHFDQEVNVSLVYDEELIPAGYTTDDIMTWFYDVEAKHWTSLKKVLVDTISKRIISATTHFTDMINGIILIPGSPATDNSMPNDIKNIKAANPSTEIMAMKVPSASNLGSANISYPIKIPAGRQGMQPELFISYSSEAANGWLGVGWDLVTPFITLDTKWGAPRFDQVSETETYLLNGQQLSPVGHRGTLIDRKTDRQFYPRVESEFQKIVRHGSKPSDYWWEITEKDGTKYFYGGKPGTGVLNDLVLKTTEGNIAHWALAETRDLNNNFVSYLYTKVSDMGVADGTVPGYQLYIKKISYTGHDTKEGKYSIVFKTTEDLHEKNRKDIIINARLGFKQVTADLLRIIEVQFDDKNIRSYELKYHDGAFYKTLLDAIVEYDAGGKEFYRHQLSYYDNVRTNKVYHPLLEKKNWNFPGDDVQGTFLNPIDNFGDQASALGGSKSIGGGGGITITAGTFDAKLYSKEMTAGGSFGFSVNDNEGMLELIDINGDNLPDKVFKKDQKLYYRPNISGPNGPPVFGNFELIEAVTDFDRGLSFTIEGGIESNFVAYAGLQLSYTTNQRSTYFADVNGDQLVDIVHQGTVYFNHINGQGKPVFTKSSNDTPSPLRLVTAMDESLYVVDSVAIKKEENDHPLHDVVKVWKAPYTGDISISSPVQLLRNTSPQRSEYTTADGVNVSIQHKQTVLWSARITESDYSVKTPVGLSAIHVDAGDQIYFRVQSVYDGAYDQVNWQPLITYSDHVNGRNDANNFPVYQFNSANDFLPTVAMSVGMPFNGQVSIKGLFDKPKISDNIRTEIVKKEVSGNQQIIWQQKLPWDSLWRDSVNLNVSVNKGDEFFFRVYSSTNVDWAAIKWSPRVIYTGSADPAIQQVVNQQGEPLFNFYPVVDYLIYNRTKHAPLAWVAAGTDTIKVSPKLLFLPFTIESGTIAFSVKKRNQLLAEDTITVTGGFLFPLIAGANDITLIVAPGDSLFIEYHTRNEKLWNSLISATATIVGDNNETITPGAQVYSVGTGSRTIYNEGKYQFGAMYRNWGQFIYNGNGTAGTQPIDETQLVISTSLTEPQVIDLHTRDSMTTDDAPEMQSSYESQNGNAASKDKFIYMIPSAGDAAWKGYDDSTYVSKTIMSASRMGKDNPFPINPLHALPTGDGAASGITKVSTTLNINVSAALIVGVSYSKGNSSQQYDYMDMNGDRYPDILSKDKIQYTRATGGLEKTAKNLGFGDIDKTDQDEIGVSLGGTFLSAGAANSKTEGKGSKAAKAGKTAAASMALSGGFNVTFDKTLFGWMDMNGDGLPDRVYNNGDVELNLGYSFAPKEKWGFNGINAGNTVGYSAGIGINLFYHSIAAGISLSRNENNLNLALKDVNGDGLPDYILAEPPVLDLPLPTTPIKVAINTGNGFADPIDWTGASNITRSISTGESINAAFCVCIPIIPIAPVAKICFNPSIEFQQGVHRETISISDIDGDDFPDLLESGKDDNLSVRLSAIGQTNLLRSVARPMGGGFVINYKRAGNTYDMPNSLWLMDSVKMTDGVSGDSPDTVVTSFEYAGGMYDRNEREFYGFKTVKTKMHDRDKGNMVYRARTETFANNNFYEKGLLVDEFLQDALGKKFNETLYKYEFRNVHDGSLLPPGFETTDAGNAFPAMAEKKTLIYEGRAAAGKTVIEKYNYDTLGNIVSFTDLGDDDPLDDYTTQITYHGVTGKYLMSAPKSMTVLSNGQTFRKKEQDINEQTGNITEIRNFSAPGIASVTNMKYDQYGNLVLITNPPNEAGQRLSYNYEYESEINTFKNKITDSYGYSSFRDYDLRFDLLTSLTDINGQKTTYKIDNAGRIIEITGPVETAANVPFSMKFEYHPEAVVPWALTRQYDPEHPGNFLETAVFMDGLQRTVQVKKDGSIFNSPTAADNEVMIVSGAVVYDAFGRAVESFYPVTELKGSTGIYNPLRDGVSSTKKIFDVLDRCIKQTLPDGSLSSKQFGFANDRNGDLQLSTITTDANGKRKEVFTDARGKITSIKNYFSQGSDIWTSYRYNALDELIAVKDDQQNTITTNYDWLGRRISVSHPDAGLISFLYDRAGLLIKKITSTLQGTGKSISYKYDQERVVHVIYPDNAQNNVKYTYGGMGGPGNRAGRIAVQEDATGAQEFFYDPLGNVIKNIRSIVVPSKGVLNYKTEWTFDTWNRLQSLIYPDGEILGYDYSAGGLFSGMHGQKGATVYNYIPQAGYDKFEQKVYQRHGNGTETFFAYEPLRRRLKQLIAETGANRKMLNAAFTYDNENNITDIINTADEPPPQLMGGSATYHFSYDDLYRLTKANGSFKGSNHEHRYELTMAYNSIGNILKKDQSHERKAPNAQNWVTQKETSYSFVYEYDAAKPHEPVKIGKQSYTYDQNGNQQGWTTTPSARQRKITWDEENRMSSLADNGALYSYIYDADGERVLRNNGGGEAVKINGQPAGGNIGIGNYTIYVNAYTVVRSGSYTKHYYAEGARIATRLEQGGQLPNITTPAGRMANTNINYAGKEEELKRALIKLYTNADVELQLSDAATQQNNDNSKAGPTAGTTGSAQTFLYFFHPDQVGNSAYITDADGEVFQHLEYFPFGETFVEEHSNTNRTPYLFNGKELDDRTGLYYYGARYYDAKTSIWQSVDPPITGQYLNGELNSGVYNSSNLGVYNYVYQNPVNLEDPDGNGPFYEWRKTWRRLTSYPDANSTKMAGKYRAKRPKYRVGVVDRVWNRNRDVNDRNVDPNTGKILKWNRKKNRHDQWHMGHRRGHEYRRLIQDLKNRVIDKEEFLMEYNNPDNYDPEDPKANMSHVHEKPGTGWFPFHFPGFN
jgi:RHS repeat-associated protein